jgi:hypothetical protein
MTKYPKLDVGSNPILHFTSAVAVLELFDLGK